MPPGACVVPRDVLHACDYVVIAGGLRDFKVLSNFPFTVAAFSCV